MEGSGGRYNIVLASNGIDTVRTPVLVTRENVEIGGWSFKKEELFLALGVKGVMPNES